MWKRLMMSAMVLGILGTSQWTQEDDGSGGRSERLQSGAIPTFELRELSLVQYRPQHMHAGMLMTVVQRMLGRHMQVVERGRVVSPLSNLSELAGTILIYDTQEYSARVLEMLKALDQPAQEPEEVEDMSQYSEIMVEYTARNVPVNYLNSALGSFGDIHEYSVVGNRMIAARIPEYAKATFLEFMDRVDQPDPCVVLTCYLLKGADPASMASGPQPPREVVESLNAILPDLKFRSIGFSMVQSTISEGRQIELGVSGSDEQRYELKFNPLAFDIKSGDMNVLNCEFTRHKAGSEGGRGQASPQVLLRTDTVFRGNQYTVLGASGQDPVFVVIHSRMIP